jgi:ABC-type transport system involved in multi-copper enzyme maturation permease subunit
MMKYDKKGQTDSTLSSVFIPIVVIAILGISFSIITSGISINTGAAYDNTTYSGLADQGATISALSEDISSSVIGNQTQGTNVLTSTEKLVGGAYNSILLLGQIPGIYINMITLIAGGLGIPTAIVGLIISAIVFFIIGTIIYLALGRR